MTAVTYPGVYIREISSGVRTITGVATSITAFIGRAKQGPTDTQDPVLIHSFADYERTFGGLWPESPMSYSVRQFFTNGGSDALIIRVHNGATPATFDLPAAAGPVLSLEASSVGEWAKSLRVSVDFDIRDPALTDEFNLIVSEFDPVAKKAFIAESHRNVTVDTTKPRYIQKVLAQESARLRMPTPTAAAKPTNRPSLVTDKIPTANGGDGIPITPTQINGAPLTKTGIYALLKSDLFNILCIPPMTFGTDIIGSTVAVDDILTFCKDHRAFLILDAPSIWKASNTAAAGMLTLNLADKRNAAIYFPNVRMADPLKENRLEDFTPSGAIAGIYARTDSQRGVWKAPAGQETTITGAQELTVKLTDSENGDLNQLGLNCLRTFPGVGNVVWGARTVDGSDRLASEWKYIPVRRLALFIEESLFRGTQWVVFEPNDEPLWSQIRLNIGAFMQNLFRQGAFQGRTPRDAYFVKCDSETTTQNDINLGIVNVIVGFAPLKPAEFVVITIQQMAGQVQV